jgi:NAD(P)H-dependent flavin oxidoreductase YrpB (nitropropane dioxygenase family)
MAYPQIIQGGMGVAVSNWTLARAVARLGQLGVISGTALAVVLARRLQLGDLDGQIRHALDAFPFPAIAARVLHDYFIPGGKRPDAPFKLTPMPALEPNRALTELTVVANFVEVFLAKEGHDGCVGLNLLEKIQLPTLPSLYGGMLAGVDFVLMGAGIPRSIPGSLDRLAIGESADLKIDVADALPGDDYRVGFNPRQICGDRPPQLKRPLFLGIVASATLAMTLAKKASGEVNGFVVEGETAGGHNAPPRGPLRLSEAGEPIYGPRDVVDLERIRSLERPFWLGGSYGQPGKLGDALRLGAQGIQVGTAFAFCEESGICPELKRRAILSSRLGQIRVFTNPVASPTGFPFKVLQMDHTLSDPARYVERARLCDLGYLRHLYRQPEGTVGYRCPAEPTEDFERKGGAFDDTRGRMCICNGLPATIGLGQVRERGNSEPPLLTAGDDIAGIARFLKPGRDSYTAGEVILALLSQPEETGQGTADGGHSR